jgi:HK97 family phage prohead protease
MRSPDLRGLSPTIRARLGVVEGIDLREPIRGFTVQRGGRICEARSTSNIETRESDDSGLSLVGYASTYDDPYDIGPTDDWGWTEIIGRGSARKSIAERDDVYLFFDHDGLPLASTKDGTLSLSEDGVGLRSVGHIDPSSQYSMEIYRRVQRGQLDRMSFAFQVMRERWEDRDGNEESWMTAPVRRILEVKLYDTSVVSFPANPNTSVASERSTAVDPGGMTLAEAKASLAGGMTLAEAKSLLGL